MLVIKGKNYDTAQVPTFFFGDTKPLAYVLNPKAACTLALNFMFFLNHGYRYFDPIQIHYSEKALVRVRGKDLNPEAVYKFYRLAPATFSFVRDPLNRFVSGFLSKVFSDDDPLYLSFRDMLTSSCGVDLSPEADPARSCLSFARWVASQKDQKAVDGHFRPQWFNLRLGEALAPDTILRLEEPESIREFFATWIGPEQAAWFLSLRFNEHAGHRKEDFISEELKGLVREIYARDYELFYPG
jgi:hypothetical protein